MKRKNHDTGTVPSEVKIFYSKRKVLWQLFISVIVALSGVFTVYWDLKFYVGYILIIAGIYLMYQYLSKLPLTLPIIVLNDKGIATGRYGYFDWNSIDAIYVERRREWRSFSDFLVFKADRSYEILLNDLDVSFESLEKYIEVYQLRYKGES